MTPPVRRAARRTTPRARPAVELPVRPFANPGAWAKWLAGHHASSQGVWIKLVRKSSGVASVTHQEAVEVALAWGWIDGQARGRDDSTWLQKFTPRRPKSIWSKINRDRALALIARGDMQPSGLEQVTRARQDGRWDAAYDSPRRATMPDDLAAALAANPRAAEFFATLDSANRYAVLFRLQAAKKATTRAERLARFVAMLARHECLHPPRPAAARPPRAPRR